MLVGCFALRGAAPEPVSSTRQPAYAAQLASARPLGASRPGCHTGQVTRAGRLSALDSIFLPMETETQSLHIGSVLILAGPPPEPAVFREDVIKRLAGLPFHRRRVMRMPLDLGRPIWVDTPNLDPADHVHHTVLPAPGDEGQLREMVARIMVPRLDADRPLWQLWQIDGLAGDRWAVVAKAHHTMVDGRSGADVVQSLLTTVPESPPPGATAPEAGPPPSFVDLVGDLVTWVVLLPLRGIGLVARSLLAPRQARLRIRQVRFGLAQVLRPDLPASVLNGRLSSRRIWGWTGRDLAEILRVTRAAGCTVNDVYLAALAGGYRRYLLRRGEPLGTLVLRAIVPVSRQVPGHGWRLGNLASAMFVELPVHLADPVARLSAVRERTRDQKSREVAEATAAVVRMADHIPAALLFRGARAYGRSGQGRVNVVASNVPGPAEVRYLAGRRVLELVPYVPTAQEVRSTTAVVSYAGRLTIGITGDAEALPDLDHLIEAIGVELDELVKSIGSR